MSLDGRTEAVAIDRVGETTVVHFLPAGDGTISNRGAALLGDALARLLSDDAVRAVVITGAADDIFIRHASLGQIVRAARALQQGADRGAFLTSPFARLGRMLDAAEKPVIAAINGTCMGGGLEIALACTMRIAARGVTAIGLPETRLGIPPGAGGPQRLARLIGAHQARLFVLQGRVVGAAVACELGIVDALAEDPVAEALHHAEALNRSSAPVVAEIMRQLRPRDDDALEENLLGFADCLLSTDKRADLVLLRTDRFGFASMGGLADRVVNFAHWQDIDSVWVAGAAKKRSGAMPGVDWRTIKMRAKAIQDRVIPQAQSIIFT